jgi:phosphoribosyl-dephospho-CoA transferase
MRRHDLIFVGRRAWRSLLETRGGLAADPLVAGWVDNGWPLIGRRAMPGEGQGVALGLPLPPFAGKRRLSFLMQAEDIVATAPPPALRSAIGAAPRAWRPSLEDLAGLASRYSLNARVFGSLAWCAVTGLDYVTARSDLDFLLHVDGETDLQGLTAAVAAIEAVAPMRLDGELVREDGAAVNWRELHAAASEILVKTITGVALIETSRFLPEQVPS